MPLRQHQLTPKEVWRQRRINLAAVVSRRDAIPQVGDDFGCLSPTNADFCIPCSLVTGALCEVHGNRHFAH